MVPGESNQFVSIQGLNPDEEYDDRSFCTIRDASHSQTMDNEVTMLFSNSTTGRQLVDDVGRRFQYQPNTFELLLVGKNKQMVVINAFSEETIEDLGFYIGDHAICKNQLIITDKNAEPPRKLEDAEAKSDSHGGAITTYVPPPAPPPYTTGSSDFLYNYSYNPVIKQETGFVGLVNQAMTCYLNSLLQTLYMTPEFRNALYRWEFDGMDDEGTKSIPFQLQKLFLLLQTSKKSAVGTTELTTSFGWDSSEAWQQHDVQELCRVMFDALEQKFKNTGQSDLISTLYEGKLKDYVKCLQCGNESAREDTFLDVPLVVRPFGSSQTYGSVEEALHAFVTPEILLGSNQYFCEQCSEKCNAHKGLKFVKFPYLLTLQLKRFDFDPVTMHRIKLNDRVTFPEILNLNEFVRTDSREDESSESNDSNVVEGNLVSRGESSSVVDCPKSVCSKDTVQVVDATDIDEGIDVGMQTSPKSASNQEISTNERNLKKSMEKGPYVYELFSIMVHSGSANGGHYYAYIKSFNDGDWYCFNDAQVSKITYDDIQKTYGGGPARGYYSSAYSSSTNAYMLMYRQIDKNKNEVIASVEEFPQHIKDLRQSIREQEEKDRQQREIDRYMCKIKLFCQHPVQKRLIEMRLKVHKDNTLAEATATARKIMGLESIVPLNCCRLVKYDDLNDSLECSFDVADDEPIGELLGGVKSSYKFDLLLELKEPHEEFQIYKVGGTTVKIHIVDLDREEVAPSPITLRSYLQETVAMFKTQIAKFLNINASQIRMVLELYSNEMKLLDNNNTTLISEGFGKSNKAFIEFKDIEDAKNPFKSSKFYQVLDCYAHTICILVGLPKVDKIILEKLRIQENDCDKEDPNSDDELDGSTKVSGGSADHHTAKNCTEDGIKYAVDKTTYSCSSWRYSTDTTSLVPVLAVSPVSVRKLPLPGNELTKKNQSRITPDDSSQDYDEGLGDSEIGDTFCVNSCPSGHGVHSDQSEDSSLTDSERTLVGDELSPRNNSPDIMGSEMEVDAEPPQVAGLGSARLESDSAHSSSESNFQLDEHTDDNTNPSSPEENAVDTKCSKQSSLLSKKHVCDNSMDVVRSPEIHKYFRAWRYTDETGEKMLRVYVDKRTTLAALKVELEPFVGVSANCFKIYRLYSNNQEFECTRVSENLSSYTDDTRLTVKLGRALRKGEYKVKIYQLCINDSEPTKYLIDWVFLKGMSVLDAKKEILPEIKESCGLDIPLNRCRLRKKSWKNPGTVLLDGQRFEKEIHINVNWEVFLEVLEDAEPVNSPNQVTVFLRRWHPSKYIIDPFEEIVIEPTIESLNSKISDISGIPSEFIEFAKGQGTFPCEVSTLSIHKELDWHSQKSPITTWTLSVGDDGHVVYYRDAREELKKLSEEEKRELTNKENARTNKIHKASFSPRKEKALKIYTVDNVPTKSSHVTSTGTEDNKLLVPDLD